jgi:hypothetical protein
MYRVLTDKTRLLKAIEYLLDDEAGTGQLLEYLMMMMMEDEGDRRVMDFVRDKRTESSASVNIRSAYNAREERCSDLQPPGRNCMTHRQAQQDIPHTSQVLLHKNKKNQLHLYYSGAKIISLHTHYTVQIDLNPPEEVLPNLVPRILFACFHLTLLRHGILFSRVCTSSSAF